MSTIAIVVSQADEASTHIGDHLLDLDEWRRRDDPSRPDADGGGTYHRSADDAFELRTFDDLHIYLDDAAEPFDRPDFLVFASRHSGETGPLLSAHFTGNFGPAEFGGDDGELARSCPNAHAHVVASLREHAPGDYDVSMECTHHGPSDLDVPSMFVELGSGEPQWRDADAARAVARAILAIRGMQADRERTLVGFGGGHYAPRFTRVVRETDWAVGHVAANWCLEAMGELDEHRAVIDQAFTRSAADRALLDGADPELTAIIDELGYQVVSETWVRETVGVPLDLVSRVETQLATVEEGVRFGDRARNPDSDDGESRTDDGFEVTVVDEALLADAYGRTPDRTREAVASHAVAFETTENGTRPTGAIAVPDRGTYDGLIDDVAAILREHYEAVERTPDAIIVHERTFDPEAAREHGVPEGPAFGRLAAGEPVEVDGEVVDPAAVHTKRTRRYAI